MRFIDLFAGLGGFHQALEKLGHRCVFASEIDPQLADLYLKNFGIQPFGDIRKHHHEVPAHDILCAGFPCQPFSKAGDQLGFDCPQWGDLFDLGSLGKSLGGLSKSEILAALFYKRYGPSSLG